MQLAPLLQELLPGFLILRVENTTVYGANFDTFRCFRPSDTLGAFIRLDDVNRFPFAYGLILAF